MLKTKAFFSVLVLALIAFISSGINAQPLSREMPYPQRLDSIKKAIKDHGSPDIKMLDLQLRLARLYALNCDTNNYITTIKAEKLAAQLNSPYHVGLALYNRCLYFLHRGWDDSLSNASHRLYKLGKQIGSAEIEAHGLMRIAEHCYHIGNFPGAVDTATLTITLREKDKDLFGMGQGFLILGFSYGMNGGFDQTARYYNRAIELFEKSGNEYALAHAYNAMAIILRYNKMLDNALQYNKKAIDIADGHKVEWIQVIARQNYATTLYQLNRKTEAIKMMEGNLNIMMKNKNFRVASNIALTLSDFYIEQKQIDKAEKVVRIGHSLAKQMRSMFDEAETARILAGILYNSGKYKESAELALKSKLLTDTLFNRDKRKEAALLEKDFFRKQKAVELQEKEQELLRKSRELVISSILGFVGFVLLLIIFIQYRRLDQVKKKLLEQNEDINEINDELKQLNASKDKLIAIIGHDLRAPLSSWHHLPDVIEMLLDSGDTASLRRIAYEMRGQAKQTLDLLDSLLTWTMTQTGRVVINKEPIALKKLFGNFREVYIDAINKKNLSISINIDDDLQVLADSNSLSTIFRNLLSNAIKFSKPEGGSIVITAVPVQRNMVEISIEDSGIGMSDDYLKKLMDGDHTKGRIGTLGERSTGLGMILIKEMLNRNAGTISATSTEGSGTKFVITLPAV